MSGSNENVSRWNNCKINMISSTEEKKTEYDRTIRTIIVLDSKEKNKIWERYVENLFHDDRNP